MRCIKKILRVSVGSLQHPTFVPLAIMEVFSLVKPKTNRYKYDCLYCLVLIVFVITYCSISIMVFNQLFLWRLAVKQRASWFSKQETKPRLVKDLLSANPVFCAVWRSSSRESSSVMFWRMRTSATGAGPSVRSGTHHSLKCYEG